MRQSEWKKTKQGKLKCEMKQKHNCSTEMQLIPYPQSSPKPWWHLPIVIYPLNPISLTLSLEIGMEEKKTATYMDIKVENTFFLNGERLWWLHYQQFKHISFGVNCELYRKRMLICQTMLIWENKVTIHFYNDIYGECVNCVFKIKTSS